MNARFPLSLVELVKYAAPNEGRSTADRKTEAPGFIQFGEHF